MSKSSKSSIKVESKNPVNDEEGTEDEDSYVPPIREQRLYHESHPISSLNIHRSKDFSSALHPLSTVRVPRQDVWVDHLGNTWSCHDEKLQILKVLHKLTTSALSLSQYHRLYRLEYHPSDHRGDSG